MKIEGKHFTLNMDELVRVIRSEQHPSDSDWIQGPAEGDLWVDKDNHLVADVKGKMYELNGGSIEDFSELVNKVPSTELKPRLTGSDRQN